MMSRENNQKNHSRPIPGSASASASADGIIRFYLLLLLLQAVPYTAAQTNNGWSSPPPNPNDLKPDFNPSIAIIIIVLITAFFFVGFFSIYVSQCIGDDRTDRSVRPINGSVGRSRKICRGLDPAYIDTFPTFLYSDVKELKIGKGALECAVCINEFDDDETLRLIPKCDHVFHPECIDAWLVSHTTCPVCRANLVLESVHITGGDSHIQVPVSNSESGEENPPSEIEDAQNQAAITVVDDQRVDIQPPEVINPALVTIQNRPARLKSIIPRIAGKFPRSHSTGHSLVQPGENCERFTLRFPEDVRKQIMNGKLNRTTSCVAFPTGDGSVSGGSTRRGYRSGGGDGSSRGKNYLFWRSDSEVKSDQWMFTMAPPFFTRTSSVRLSRRADGDGTATPKAFLTSVKTPFDCLGAKTDGGDQTSVRSAG